MRYWKVSNEGYCCYVKGCRIDTAVRRAVRVLCEGTKIGKDYNSPFWVKAISEKEYNNEQST